MGYGSIGFLWTRPIAVTFLVITFLFLSWPYLKGIFFWLVGKAPIASQDTASDFGSEKITFGEITLLIGLSVLSIVMLVESRSYPELVGFFPTVTSYLLLGLIIWRSGYLVLRRVPWARGAWIRPSLSHDSMSWQWSMGTLLLYVLLTYSIGFLPATALYLIAIPFLLRYQGKLLILVTGGVVTFGVAVFIRLLNIVFPIPYLTILF